MRETGNPEANKWTGSWLLPQLPFITTVLFFLLLPIAFNLVIIYCVDETWCVKSASCQPLVSGYSSIKIHSKKKNNDYDDDVGKRAHTYRFKNKTKTKSDARTKHAIVVYMHVCIFFFCRPSVMWCCFMSHPLSWLL